MAFSQISLFPEIIGGIAEFQGGVQHLLVGFSPLRLKGGKGGDVFSVFAWERVFIAGIHFRKMMSGFFRAAISGGVGSWTTPTPDGCICKGHPHGRYTLRG